MTECCRKLDVAFAKPQAHAKQAVAEEFCPEVVQAFSRKLRIDLQKSVAVTDVGQQQIHVDVLSQWLSHADAMQLQLAVAEPDCSMALKIVFHRSAVAAVVVKQLLLLHLAVADQVCSIA